MRLTLDRLGHRFADAPWLFRDVTLTLAPGHSYALVGPSGSGKSTLMSLIAGWAAPAEGHITAVGIHKTNWVFQSPHGMPRRTALDHVVLPFLARNVQRAYAEAQARDLLAGVNLADAADREFRSLSGGEAQRLMLARAVAAAPDLLLVDEPTAQLDLATARKVNAAIAALVSPARIVVVATHDEGTRDACTDRLDLAAYNDLAQTATAP